MQYVFGPIPSRRLGQSLGIDPVPFKTCNWNCVYCQLGRTSPLTHERSPLVSSDEVLREVERVLAQHAPGEIDWITFVGSGDPTLHSELGQMIRQVKCMSPLPVAVITNGALLYRPEVRAELLVADAVLPSLDAGTEELYRRIDRPTSDLGFDRFVEGLVDFRREYEGKLWLEVMLIGGVNDGEAELRALAEVIRRIEPDQVHLGTPTRPPTEPWVRPPDEQGMKRALAVLGEIAHIVGPASGDFDLGEHATVTDAVVATVQRHPMRMCEILGALDRWPAEEVQRALDVLTADARLQRVERNGQEFFSFAGARYIDQKAPSST